MITKYKTNYSSNKIERVEIVRETAKQVVLLRYDGKERREAKESDWGSYFDTWEEAHSYLMGKWERKIKHARAHLESIKGTYGNIKGMKPE